MEFKLLIVLLLILFSLLLLSYNNTNPSNFIEVVIWIFGIIIFVCSILFSIVMYEICTMGKCPPGS